jgi:P27 family predicted phage terminase small subunit
MTRGRKPKPLALRVIEGNPGKRALASKNVAKPPVSAGLRPPAHLNADAKRHWREMARQLEVLGLLAAIDRGALAVMCDNYGLWAQSQRSLRAYAATTDGKTVPPGMMKHPSGATVAHPLLKVARDARRDYLKAAAEFGMTPSARSRVEIGKTAAGDRAPSSKFSGLIGGKARA